MDSRPTVREYIEANLEDLGKLGYILRIDSVERATGATRSRICKVFKSVYAKKRDNAATDEAGSAKAGMTREDLMAKYDQATKTRKAMQAGVKTLTDDDEILTQAQFAMRCPGVSHSLLKQIASEPEFVKYQFRVGDQVHWSTPATKLWALQNVTKVQDV